MNAGRFRFYHQILHQLPRFMTIKSAAVLCETLMLMTCVDTFDGFSMTPLRMTPLTVATVGVAVTIAVAVVLARPAKFPNFWAVVAVPIHPNALMFVGANVCAWIP